MPRAKYKKDDRGMYYFDKRINGKRIHVRGKTVAEVDEKLEEILKAEEETNRIPCFEEIAQAYLDEASERVRSSTMRGYKPRVEAAIKEFEGYRIDKIEPFDISRFYRKLAKDGYSRKTIANQHSIMIDIFQTWIDGKWRGDRNPANLASLPNTKPPQIREPPTEEQLKAVKQHPDGVGFIANFLMYTGMRLGEAQGIQVKDIDFNEILYGVKGTISVNKSYLWHGNQPYCEQTKTYYSIRKIPIFSPLLPLLVDRCKGLKPTDFVISQRDKPFTKNEYNRRWEQYCLDLGFATTEERVYTRKNCAIKTRLGETYTKVIIRPQMSAHQFRHEMATTCYEAGVPELVAQKILGHADIATTHKIYTHIRERMMTHSAIMLNQYFIENAE